MVACQLKMKNVFAKIEQSREKLQLFFQIIRQYFFHMLVLLTWEIYISNLDTHIYINKLHSFENILYSYKNADSGHKSFFLLNQWNMWNENWYLFVHSSGSKGFSIWHNIVISWIFVAKIEQKKTSKRKENWYFPQ